MPDAFENALHRFEIFARQILAPAAYFGEIDLSAEVFQTREPVSFEHAQNAEYRPATPGLRWGPVWSTAWFRLRGNVPDHLDGQHLVLRFSTGTEATLWQDGVPVHGLDVNHDCVTLFEDATPGQQIELYVEAACNRPFGVALFPWEAPEEHLRWSEENPGRLERAAIAGYRANAWRLGRLFDFGRHLLAIAPKDAQHAVAIRDALDQLTRRVDAHNLSKRADTEFATLKAALKQYHQPTGMRGYAVGHAHIDTAWLWPIRETRRKCIRTFASTLRLMERFPSFRFLCSQAQQYAWLEEDAPALFEQIKQQVNTGRWEAAGAMWIEPDCNLPSGESLVRQVLHGTRYWEEKFGAHGKQRLLYLPDTFGFCAALPQIMKLSGLDTFITNKLWWNDTNEFPHVNFVWRGLDGSEVLAHVTPGGDYNSDNHPKLLNDAQKRLARLNHSDCGVWLHPFGYGDGGGGPNEETVLRIDFADRAAGMPHIELGSTNQFCDALHKRVDQMRATGQSLPIWDGELYLEFHRGTYTTVGWLKRANRRAEQALRKVEWLAFFGPRRRSDESAKSLMNTLDQAWEIVLLNQFHDIIPGSSIREVYDDARKDFDRFEKLMESASDEALEGWGIAEAGNQDSKVIYVFNPTSSECRAVIEIDGDLHYTNAVPAFGTRALAELPDTELPLPVDVDGRRISNEYLSITIDDAGRIASLRLAEHNEDFCLADSDGTTRPMNQLALYRDVPHHYDAWEIPRHDELKPLLVGAPAEKISIVEADPLRATIAVERPIGTASRLSQRYTLSAGSPRVDIHTRIDWHEERMLLRTLFPVDVHARTATYETQFGHIARPTHQNTPWDRAMHEVPAQRWMDLSQPGKGMALLNNCKYGHSCIGNVIGLSLLRAPMFPDPTADRGTHEFTYSLMPHAGDWRAAGVDREAEALNAPMFFENISAGGSERWQPFTIDCGTHVGIEIVAAKRAEADDRLILRLVETHGGGGTVTIRWQIAITAVEAVNLLERPLPDKDIRHDEIKGTTEFSMRPFEIVTLAIERTD